MREKYVKWYFVLLRLLVSDFLFLNVLFWSWSSIKKFKVPGSQIFESWVLSPESWALSPGFRVPGSGSWVLDLGSGILGPVFWVLGLRSWVPGPGSRVLVLDYAIFDDKKDKAYRM